MNSSRILIIIFFLIFIGAAFYIIFPKLKPILASRFAKNTSPSTAQLPSTSHPADAVNTITPIPSVDPLITSLNTDLKPVLNKYLAAKIGLANMGGQVLCSYEPLYASQSSNNIKSYIWVICQEYYRDSGVIKKGTGYSIPAVVNISLSNQPTVTSHQIPRSGKYYSADLKTLFPPLVLSNDIFTAGSLGYTRTMARINSDLDTQKSQVIK